VLVIFIINISPTLLQEQGETNHQPAQNAGLVKTILSGTTVEFTDASNKYANNNQYQQMFTCENMWQSATGLSDMGQC
jgi:hypothetical protein